MGFLRLGRGGRASACAFTCLALPSRSARLFDRGSEPPGRRVEPAVISPPRRAVDRTGPGPPCDDEYACFCPCRGRGGSVRALPRRARSRGRGGAGGALPPPPPPPPPPLRGPRRARGPRASRRARPATRDRPLRHESRQRVLLLRGAHD